ncbi:EAL domain, c-di-GMP-specific phosphodiesterase class I (or its enzymatically inactive variant) [Arsukibacterium tuosuense]|uniref:EAL domain, c-di-GMP-specific phosphodiesterase class I (Or its enzymatically inactive variant) n=1 Tax=Arsukibacterium tuosuense TaxID=1323745 RepID=A0A285ID36_9GAMM|nr:EAL domain-containing protein [Arsukibacterium tuosuense]SNY45898.1 EAL domain, c-di-GMP-specific phosphodiesterase class I (or its enzymatically inactive variant) [Arsukibacterium tuosuense]
MLKVLVLDDDADNCLTLEHIIRFAGHQVQSVYDSSSFLSLVSSWRPQVVIVDLLLGDTDGITVLTDLAPSINKPDVIVLSGAHQRLLEAASRSASSHGFKVLGTLAKPFTPETLRQLLGKHTTAAQLNQRIHQPQKAVLSVAELERAFELQNFYLVYQPKIDCRTSSLVGFEALCRLNLPGLGEISPEQFIPLCEQHGLIDRLTQFVINTAVPWFAGFVSSAGQHSQNLNNKVLKLAINISALSIAHSDIFSYLIAQCARCNVEPGNIILELTETAAMSDPIASLDTLTRLRLYGFQLSIDDFGTGYSSILQLVRLPFSELKIDKNFVGTAAESKESRLVISSVIDMAHALGLSVTAEGIEDRQTLAFLQKKHCDSAQGFYIARPLTPSQVEDWVVRHQDDKELARLKALRALDILDSAPEERFDRIIRLTQRIFAVPVCTLSLVDQHRIWYKSKIGMKHNEIERNGALCELAIRHSGSFFVADTLFNTETNQNNMVIGKPFVRFYAGHAIKAPNGVVIGSLCMLDFDPRPVTNFDAEALQDLATMLEDELTRNSKMTLDPLTQLKNRASFDNRALSLLKLCQNHQLHMQLVNIKVHFDSPEHADIFNLYYDRIIRETAKLIKKSFAGADLIARVEENSFIILHVAQDAELIEMAITAFFNLAAAEQDKKQHNIPFSYAATELDCKMGELSSIQQLYMKLDLAQQRAVKYTEKQAAVNASQVAPGQ